MTLAETLATLKPSQMIRVTFGHGYRKVYTFRGVTADGVSVVWADKNKRTGTTYVREDDLKIENIASIDVDGFEIPATRISLRTL